MELVRSLLGMTQQDLAGRLGVAMSTYHRYASGERTTIKSEQLRVLAEMGVDLTWLVTGEGEALRPGAERPEAEALRRALPDPAVALQQALAPPRLRDGGVAQLIGSPSGKAPELPNGFVLVPRYDIEASAGGGALAGEENVLDYMAFQEAWVRRALRVDPSRLALITATGDSMEPAIRPGDLLLIDCSVETVMDDSIYLVSLNEFLLVKRIQKLLRGLIVKSDNPNYTPMTLSPEEARELRIRGRVRWVGRLI